MINVNDFKTGVTIKYDGNLFLVIEFQHVKPGKGPAFVRSKLKNLRTGATIDITFNAGIKVETALISRKKMVYLYQSGTNFNFMNTESYEQVEIDESKLKDEKGLLKENLEVELTFFEGELLGINLPDKIELLITSTEPSIKGNTTNNAQKEAILETGLMVKVPLFIDEGETIVVSSKDKKYVSRA